MYCGSDLSLGWIEYQVKVCQPRLVDHKVNAHHLHLEALTVTALLDISIV